MRTGHNDVEEKGLPSARVGNGNIKPLLFRGGVPLGHALLWRLLVRAPPG